MNPPSPPPPTPPPASAWHASQSVLERFAADPSSVDEARASSLEAHLIACATCRSALNGVVDQSIAVRSWNAVADVIDQPRRRPLERVLDRVGVPDGWARLLAATPGLTIAWAAGVIAVAVFVVVASRAEDARGAFLVLAPLLPVIAVAALFTPTADPAGEAGVATPMHGFGLVMRRSLMVLSTVFVALVAADLAMGKLGVSVVAWALPSLALTASVLALATWHRIEVVMSVLIACWLAIVGVMQWRAGIETALADSVTFGRSGQQVSIAVLVIALAVLTARRDRFETQAAR